MQFNYHYSIKNPKLNNTGYIIAIANMNDKHDRSAPSHYHWKILKCRMVIFSNSSILACPDKTDVKQIHIVFNKVGDDYDKLNSLFLKFSLAQEGAIRTTTPEIFEMCFSYTLSAKIAPTWNTLGFYYLINNRDFLTTIGIQEGVQFYISSNDYSTSLDLKPVNINLMKTTNEISPGEFVRVLPSLNKAVVEECSKTLPEEGNFKSYKDIRRHWKNIHGYRLSEEEPSYFMVRFWRGDPLTYPNTCVTRHFPIITPMPKPREDECSYKDPISCLNKSDYSIKDLARAVTGIIAPAVEVVLSRFMSCLKSKMPFFLGIPLTTQTNIESRQMTNVVKSNLSQVQSQDPPISLCTPTQHNIHNLINTVNK